MAFRFQWPQFEADLVERVRLRVETALNASMSPNSSPIVAPIRVIRFSPGGQPPQLDLLEVGELSREVFRGIFRLQYHGNACLSLATEVQVNPIHSLDPQSDDPSRAPLIVPMELEISGLKLNALFTLYWSVQRGVTLSFKNEPLEAVEVTSSFDQMGRAVKAFLQKEIERRLGQAIRLELPRILHQQSLKHTLTRLKSPKLSPKQTFYEVPKEGVLHRTPSAISIATSRDGLASLMRTHSQSRIYSPQRSPRVSQASLSPLNETSLLRLLQKPDEGLASLVRKQQ